MDRFEYTIIGSFENPDKLCDELGDMNSKGWEVVSFTYNNGFYMVLLKKKRMF